MKKLEVKVVLEKPECEDYITTVYIKDYGDDDISAIKYDPFVKSKFLEGYKLKSSQIEKIETYDKSSVHSHDWRDY
jgi:hypothetical protein